VTRVRAGSRLAAGSALLLAGLAALVAAAWWLVGRPEETARAAREAARPLPFRPAGVQEVIVDAGGAPYRLVRGRPGWRLAGADGADAAADGEAVERLLAALADLRPRAALREPAAALAGLGLDPPRARIALVLERGERLALDLGEDHPFDRSVPARVRREGELGGDRAGGGPAAGGPAAAGRAASGPVEVLLLPAGSRGALAPPASALRTASRP
jgi:hypothetical protein